MANLNSRAPETEDLVTSYNSLRNSMHYASKRITKRDAIKELSREYGLSQTKVSKILDNAESNGTHVYSRKGFYDSFKNEGMVESVAGYLENGLSLFQVAEGLGVSENFVGSVLRGYDSGDNGRILYRSNLKVASGEGTVRDGSRGPFRSLGAAAANDPNVFGKGAGDINGPVLGPEDINRLAAEYNVAPDVITSSLMGFAKRKGGDFDGPKFREYLVETGRIVSEPQIVSGAPVESVSAVDPAAMPVSPLMIPVSQTPAPRDYNSLLEEIADSKDAALEKRSRAQNLLESIPMGGTYDPTRNAVREYITGLNDNELCQGVPLTAGAASADSAPAGDEVPLVALIPGESPVEKEEPSEYEKMESVYSNTLSTIRNNTIYTNRDRLNQVRDMKDRGVNEYCEVHGLDKDHSTVDDVRRMLEREESLLERFIVRDKMKTDSTKDAKGVSPSTDGGSWWDRNWKRVRDVAFLGTLVAGTFLALKTANRVDNLESRPTAYVQLTKEDYKVMTGLYAGETQKVLDTINARENKQDKKIASLETIAAAQSGDLNKSINALPDRIGQAVGNALNNYAKTQKSEHDAILKNVSNLIDAYNQKSAQQVVEVKPVPVETTPQPRPADPIVESLMVSFYDLTKQIGKEGEAGSIEAATYRRKIEDSKNDADKIEWLKIAIEKLKITHAENQENKLIRGAKSQ